MKYRFFHLTFAAVAAALTLTGCDSDLWKFDDQQKGVYMVTEGSPISTMLEESGQYQEWVHVLNYSQCYSSLNSLYDANNRQVLFTMFAPTDEALKAHYASRNVGSIEELGVKYAAELVKTMTLNESDTLRFSEKFSSNVKQLVYTSIAGKDLTLTVDEEAVGFLLNEKVHISRDYVSCANGLVYKADGCVTPLVETLWDRLAESKSGILMQAIEQAGLRHSLETVADTSYVAGRRVITPHRFTVLNVTDQTFARFNINTYQNLCDELVAHSATPEVGADSLVRQYVRYHMFDALYPLDDLKQMVGSETSRLRSTMAPNTILVVSVDEEDPTRVVLNAADIEKQYLVDGSSFEAKNGYLHEVSGWVPVFEPKPSTVVWDLADYAEVRNALGTIYQPIDPVSDESQYKASLSGLACYEVETVMGSKNRAIFDLQYMGCNKTFAACLNHDRVIFNMGYLGSVAMQTPTIVKGKYKVEITMVSTGVALNFIKNYQGSNGGKMHIVVDKEIDPDTKKMVSCLEEFDATPFPAIKWPLLGGVGTTVLKDEIEFTETKSHNFKFTLMDAAASSNTNYAIHVDVITFTPIE